MRDQSKEQLELDTVLILGLAFGFSVFILACSFIFGAIAYLFQ